MSNFEQKKLRAEQLRKELNHHIYRYYVENENDLVQKYQKQLEIYKEALEKGLDKVVKEVYIYSLYLNKEIKLDI